MSHSIRYWLLGKDVRQQLEQHTISAVSTWFDRWGLITEKPWSVDICSSIDSEDLNYKKLDLCASKNNRFLFGMSYQKCKQFIASQIVKKNINIDQSILLISLVKKCIHEFQSDYMVGQSTPEILESADIVEPSMIEAINNASFVKIQLSNKDFQMDLFLSVQLVDSLIDIKEESAIDSTGLVDRISSISEKVAKVKIDYGDVNISVHELSTISVGDVICLDKSISSPMSVCDVDGRHLFDGYLGVKDSQLALKIAVDD